MTSSDWAYDENLILKAHYPEHGCNWDGWELLLPTRTCGAIENQARSIGLVEKEPASPYEERVVALFDEGHAPSQIDEMLELEPGMTRLILSKRWERLNG